MCLFLVLLLNCVEGDLQFSVEQRINKMVGSFYCCYSEGSIMFVGNYRNYVSYVI